MYGSSLIWFGCFFLYHDTGVKNVAVHSQAISSSIIRRKQQQSDFEHVVVEWTQNDSFVPPAKTPS